MNDADNVYYLDDDLDSAMNAVDETKIPSDEEYGKMLTEDKDDVEDEMFDKYLNAELMIDRGGETVRGTVVKRTMPEIQLAGDMLTQRWIRESTKWNSLMERLKGIVQILWQRIYTHNAIRKGISILY